MRKLCKVTSLLILLLGYSAVSFANDDCYWCLDGCDTEYRMCEDYAYMEYNSCWFDCWDTYGGEDYWNDHGYMFDNCEAACEM